MARSHRSAAIVAAVILLVAGAHAHAAADRGRGVSEREGKQIVAIFAAHPRLLRVMRRAIAAIEKESKRARGRRGLLQADELCVTFEGSGECDEVAAASADCPSECWAGFDDVDPYGCARGGAYYGCPCCFGQ